MNKLMIIISLLCFSANAQNINIQSNTNINGFNSYYPAYQGGNYNFSYNGNRELILADAITSFIRVKLLKNRNICHCNAPQVCNTCCLRKHPIPTCRSFRKKNRRRR